MLGLALTRSASAKPWWPQGASFAADFVAGRYMSGNVEIGADTALQFSRPSAKLAPDSAGAYRSFDPHQPARTNRGLWLETASGNAIGNNAMIGANVGTQAMPQDWSFTPSAGLSREVLAVGTTGGLAYLDMRLYGTASSAGPAQISFDPVSAIAAAVGETWTLSAMISYAAGGTLPANCRLRLREDNASGVNVGIRDMMIAPTTSLTRFASSQILVTADTAFVRPVLGFGLSTGAAYDFSFRIMLPCLERNAAVSSPIVSAGTRGSRSADALVIGLPTGTHNLSLVFETGAPVAVSGATGWFAISNELGSAPLQSITATRV